MARLTDKQQMFVKEYLIDLNATQAAIRAGYSEKAANREGGRLLSNVDIQNAIQEAQKSRNKQVQVDAEYVLKRLVEIDNMDVADIVNADGDLLPVEVWPEAWRKSISAIDIQQMKVSDDVEAFVKKIKFPDKLKTLELLGRHIGVQAFKDNVEHVGEAPKIIINRPDGD